MADPFTGSIAALGLVSTIAGGAMSASGAAAKGQADSQMYGYKAGLANLNAQINRQNADYAVASGGVNARRSGMNTGFTVANQKVAQAASGIDVNSGSAALTRESQREVGRMDQATIRTNAGREAQSFENRARGLDAEADLNLLAGRNAKTASNYTVAGSILGTAGSVSSKWLQASQVFGFGSGTTGALHNSAGAVDYA